MKKAFTLVELLCVIIIVGILLILAIPSIANLINNEESNISDTMEKIIVQAGELYIQDNSGIYTKTEGNTYCIKFSELISNEYLSSPLKDPITSEEVNTDEYVKVLVENGGYSYSVTSTCEEKIEEPPATIICKRATTLHTETCSQDNTSFYCSGTNYDNLGTTDTSSTITYGNLGTSGKLTSGDAFDCDVNNDGVYNATNERFYYVSDLYNTTTKTFNSNYAVLVYYNNTVSGVADNTSLSLIDYNLTEEYLNGPVTATGNLPTTSQWTNVKLSNTKRTILTKDGTSASTFNYSGYAARLLTYQEVELACSASTGTLDNCQYLMENTQYSSDSMGTEGYWLETPGSSYDAVTISAVLRGYGGAINSDNVNGVRPAIEVLKTNIQY